MRKFALVIIAFNVSSGCYYNAQNFVTNGSLEAKFVLLRSVPTTVVMSDGLSKPFVDLLVKGDSLYGWAQIARSGKRDSVRIPLAHVKRIVQRKRSGVLALLAVFGGLLVVPLAVIVYRTGGA